VDRLRGQAQAAVIGDLTKWSEVMAAVRHALALLAESEADLALHQKVAAVLAEVGREHAAAEKLADEVERDRKLLKELETIRGSRSEPPPSFDVSGRTKISRKSCVDSLIWAATGKQFIS
jgi:hypothetical protein